VQKRLNQRYAVWVADSDVPTKAQVQSHLPGGANVPSYEGTFSAAAMRPYVKLLWSLVIIRSGVLHQTANLSKLSGI